MDQPLRRDPRVSRANFFDCGLPVRVAEPSAHDAVQMGDVSRCRAVEQFGMVDDASVGRDEEEIPLRPLHESVDVGHGPRILHRPLNQAARAVFVAWKTAICGRPRTIWKDRFVRR